MFWEHCGIILEMNNRSKYDDMSPYEMFRKNNSLKTQKQYLVA